MKVNTELATQVYMHLSLHPEKHDQEAVVDGIGELPNGNLCGTVGCIAGWTCAYAGLLEPVRGVSGKVHYVDTPDWFGSAMSELSISEGLAEAMFSAYIPEEIALRALGLLATGGGSEMKAVEYLEEEGRM